MFNKHLVIFNVSGRMRVLLVHGEKKTKSANIEFWEEIVLYGAMVRKYLFVYLFILFYTSTYFRIVGYVVNIEFEG